jgi:hypothetical protein
MTPRAGDSLLLHPRFSGNWENETVTHIRFKVILS